MDLIDELVGLIKALNDAGVRYALCGGLAMAVHGHPRATQDIDLLIPKEELAKIQQVAATVGFRIPSGRMPFKVRTPLAMDIYRVSKAVGSILIPLDMIIVRRRCSRFGTVAWNCHSGRSIVPLSPKKV